MKYTKKPYKSHFEFLYRYGNEKYSIGFEVTDYYYFYRPIGKYVADWVERTDKYYFIYLTEKGFKTNKSRNYKRFRSISEAIDYIKKLLADEEPYITDCDMAKIYRENYKNDYCANKEMLTDLMMKHKRGSKKTQYLIEEQLTDINFHSYVGALMEKDYEKFQSLIEQDFE